MGALFPGADASRQGWGLHPGRPCVAERLVEDRQAAFEAPRRVLRDFVSYAAFLHEDPLTANPNVERDANVQDNPL